MRKSNKKGFTLVELVVVIAIIGVLAAILIPTMMNYVKKSRLKTANANAKLVYTTINNKASDIVADGDAVAALSVTSPVDISTWNGDTNKRKAEVYQAMKDNGDGIGYACLSYDPNSDDAENWAQWQTNDTTTDQITGQFPDAAKEVSTAEGWTFGSKGSNP